MRKRFYPFWLALLFGAGTSASAQSIGPSILNANGGGGTISGDRYDYSIGEMSMVATFSSPSIIVTQGVLQPASIGRDTTEVHAVSLYQDIRVFPNPSSSVVNIEYRALGEGTMEYRLTDMLGKTILNRSEAVKQGVNRTQIDISNLANASYMLEIIADNQNKSASYKIQKLN